MKRTASVVVLCTISLLMVGCMEPPPPPPPPPVEPPPPPPPPSAEELFLQVNPILVPVHSVATTADEALDPDEQQMYADQLRATLASVAGQINWPLAKKRLISQLKQSFYEAEQKRNWEAALTVCNFIKIIDPDTPNIERDSARIGRLAGIKRNMPGVRITGHVEDKATKDIYFFLTVLLPQSGGETTVKVRTGDQLLVPEKLMLNDADAQRYPDRAKSKRPVPCGLTMIGIAGNLKGVDLEYRDMETGEVVCRGRVLRDGVSQEERELLFKQLPEYK